ncbi:MAG: helix-turn-helix domain-containing protein [Oligoflexales bacterium]
MAIVWFVGKTSELPLGFMTQLQSEFPVRVVESFDMLAHIHHHSKAKPDAIIGMGISDSRDALRKSQMVDLYFAGAKKIFLADGVDPKENISDSIWMMESKTPDLCQRIGAIVGGVKRRDGSFVLQFKNIILNFEELTLRILPGIETIDIPLKEARLLKLFMAQPNVCLTRDQIRDSVWGNIAISGRTIDSYICRIRKYLAGGGVDIESIYGGGYVLR